MNVSPLSKIQLKLIKLGCFGKFCTYKCNAVRQAPKGELTLRSSMAVYFCVVTFSIFTKSHLHGHKMIPPLLQNFICTIFIIGLLSNTIKVQHSIIFKKGFHWKGISEGGVRCENCLRTTRSVNLMKMFLNLKFSYSPS